MGKPTPIQQAHNKVRIYHATKVGTMATALGEMGSLSKMLADLYFEVDERTQAEVQFMLAHLHRFSRQIRQLQGVRLQALQEAGREIQKVQKLLKDVDEGGYGLKRLGRDAYRDLTLVKRVQANLGDRTREAAFVLAELEQQVDPLPGMVIASAAQRRANVKRRQKHQAAREAKKTPTGTVAPPAVPAEEEEQ